MDDKQQEKKQLDNDGRQMTLMIKSLEIKFLKSILENSFGLTAVTLVDKACKLDCVQHILVLESLCLKMKILQINREKDMILEFL